MRTYKEALIDRMQTFKTEKIGEQEPSEMLPIVLSQFILSMSAILTWQASSQIDSESPLASEIMAAFSGNDLLNHTALHSHLHGFLSWLLSQQIEDEYWYRTISLAEKWNEYAEMKRKERE